MNYSPGSISKSRHGLNGPLYIEEILRLYKRIILTVPSSGNDNFFIFNLNNFWNEILL